MSKPSQARRKMTPGELEERAKRRAPARRRPGHEYDRAAEGRAAETEISEEENDDE